MLYSWYITSDQPGFGIISVDFLCAKMSLDKEIPLPWNTRKDSFQAQIQCFSFEVGERAASDNLNYD